MCLDCSKVIKNNRNNRKNTDKKTAKAPEVLQRRNTLTFNRKSISKAVRVGLMWQLLRQLCPSWQSELCSAGVRNWWRCRRVVFPASVLGLPKTVFRDGHQKWMLMFEEVRGKIFNKGTLKLGNTCEARTKNFAMKTWEFHYSVYKICHLLGYGSV